MSASLAAAMIAAATPGPADVRLLVGLSCLVPLLGSMCWLSVSSGSGRRAWSSCALVALIAIGGIVAVML